MSTKTLLKTGFASLTLAAVNGAYAQDTIGFDDYNTAVAGTDYVSRVFSPDNSGNTGFGGLQSPTFGGSNFDLFGIARRDSNVGTATESNGEPFDVFDNSADSFPGDVIGFNSIGTDGFVVTSDTVNGAGGLVQLDYVFDISGYENLQVKMDWGAFGDFEWDGDSFAVQAGINGGSKSTIMTIGMTEAQDLANDTYTLTMASGTIADIYFDPFYDQATWDGLVNNGPSGNIGYHPDDNGTNGDDVAQDGFIPEPTALNPDNETRAYADGGFTDQQVQAYTDPLRASSNIDGFASEVILNNILQTITADVAGTGDTLELSILGATGGSVEYIIFDNVEVVGDLIGGELLAGDVNEDGIVDLADLQIVGDNWMGTGLARGEGDLTGDGNVDLADLQIIGDNWQSTLAASALSFDEALTTVAVPEPSSLALLGLGGLLIARRRRA